MKKLLLGILLALIVAPTAPAIPNVFFGNGQFFGPVIPAFPRFNANLTREFFDNDNWLENEFPGPWEDQPALDGTTVKRMTEMPVVLGGVPTAIYAYSDDEGLREMSITYLDAGSFFGFKLGGEKTQKERQAGSERRSEFGSHYNRISRVLRETIEKGVGSGKQTVIGRSHLLRSVFMDYEVDDFVLRLATRENHSISIHVMRKDRVVGSFADQQLLAMSDRERAALLVKNVTNNERGDLMIDGIPMYTQGNTPFCGVHSLAMAAHYYGLRMHPEDLIAGADLQNTGSAKGSNIFGIYHAAAEEVGMKATVSSRFDARKVQKALEAGMPVVVWRRVTYAREQAHHRFAKTVAEDPNAILPAASDAEKTNWPNREDKGSPSHASVVSGINSDLKEVIITEPWGEHARKRHMHFEEMEASAYAVFYFEL
jgi:hypothetical protein